MEEELFVFEENRCRSDSQGQEADLRDPHGRKDVDRDRLETPPYKYIFKVDSKTKNGTTKSGTAFLLSKEHTCTRKSTRYRILLTAGHVLVDEPNKCLVERMSLIHPCQQADLKEDERRKLTIKGNGQEHVGWFSICVNYLKALKVSAGKREKPSHDFGAIYIRENKMLSEMQDLLGPEEGADGLAVQTNPPSGRAPCKVAGFVGGHDHLMWSEGHVYKAAPGKTPKESEVSRHTADTRPGESGSPILLNDHVAAIHTGCKEYNWETEGVTDLDKAKTNLGVPTNESLIRTVSAGLEGDVDQVQEEGN